MTEEELESYEEIILDIRLKSGEKISGLLRDTVSSTKEPNTQRHFIPNGKITFYKQAVMEGDTKTIDELRSVIDIRDIERVVPVDAKYGILMLRNEISKYPNVKDDHVVQDLVEAYIVRTFGPESHYLNELSRIMDSHYSWIGSGDDDGRNMAGNYRITLHLLNKLLDNIKAELKKFSNYKILDIDPLVMPDNGKEVDAPAIVSEPTAPYKIVDDFKGTKKSGEVHVLIASPSDVREARKDLLERMETKFRVKGFEESSGKRLIVHGWEEMPSQTGHGQSLINHKLVEQCDIVVALFKHRLGTPVIDPVTKKQRSASGTAEELLLAIRNEDPNNAPLGMAYFYQEAPVISLDAMDFEEIKSEWKKLKDFKSSIDQEILYQTYNNEADVLDMVCEDLRKNIIDYFTESK